MKYSITRMLLVTAAVIIVPTHVFAETVTDTSNSSTKVIHYTQSSPRAETRTSTTYHPVAFYDNEGYVREDNRTVIQAMQQALRDAGFYKLGDVNGVWTQHTADALYSYQKANGLRPTARLDYVTGQKLGMVMPAEDKSMEGSTRAPAPNGTTRHAMGMSGRRVIQDPTNVVYDEYDSNGNLISRDINGNRVMNGSTERHAEMDRNTYHREYRHLNESKVQDLQQNLADAGFYKGGVDGVWGPQTAKALRSYQAANGLRATGKLNSATIEKLGMVESENDVAPAAGQ